MKRFVFCTLALFLTAGTAWAAKTTYVATNHRFNYVKIKEVSGPEAEGRAMTHPAKVDEQGLKAALASVNLARSYVIKKEADTQRVFNDPTIEFLAPNLVRAFAQAGPTEMVVFSYLSKNPFFIIRNDRLNICQAWIHNDELHIKFEKLYAKITGDVDKRGGEVKAIARARGLRVKLELGEGQKLGIDDPDEIVLDMHYNYAKKPEEPRAPEGVTMAGEKAQPGVQPGQEPAATATAPEEKAPRKKEAKAAKSKDASLAAQAPVPAPQKTAKERLEELEQLKKEGLINKKEYEEKKKDILKEL